MATAIRLSTLSLGLICATLGCYGAYEFAHGLEGRVTYLVLAAPVIAASAALIPPIAETAWRQGAPLKALLWWAAMVPAGAVVFFSSWSGCTRRRRAQRRNVARIAALPTVLAKHSPRPP